ncbi:phage tail terminator protein [Enterobacillus tribolii]|uniref:Minor tail protein U n=1 Tax=Enterobacillus tribolii TaxID=1487935 RepID=A0A370R2Q4_9GAMM|nr:phage tail terminator protein [Enterobacillus tribolii]MBW7984721.1 phage tail protein [Enterobacillus tribolii]RDK96721.1 minor tail protein U [Enterobacillus tribolii]
MKKHIEIRQAVMDAIKSASPEATRFYDGRPEFLSTQDLPAIAIYLSDAECTAEAGTIGEYGWQAVLHAEVFLQSDCSDTDLDCWIEQYLSPAVRDSVELNTLTITNNPQGYDYLHDDEATTWRSADLRSVITYRM